MPAQGASGDGDYRRHTMADAQPAGSSKIYVGNLPRDVEKTEVEDAFARCGAIASVFVARNPPGFAFVVS